MIRNLALEDEGEVKVKASNIAGFVECSAELFVDERILTPTPSKMGYALIQFFIVIEKPIFRKYF